MHILFKHNKFSYIIEEYDSKLLVNNSVIGIFLFNFFSLVQYV